MGIGKRIKEAREKKSLTQEELGRLIGVTGSAITNYEKETSHPKEPIMYALIDALGVDANFLFQDCVKIKDSAPSQEEMEHIKKYRALDEHGREIVDTNLEIEYKRCQDAKARAEAEKRRQAEAAAEAKRRAETEAQYDGEHPEYSRKIIRLADRIGLDPSEITELRFDDQKASAGSGFEVDQERMEPWYVLRNSLTQKADYCVEVSGRSMEPKFYDGDIILICEQSAVNPGEIGLFLVDNCGYVKKMSEDGDELISINPDYENISLKNRYTVRCFGKVLGALKPEWIVER